MFSYTFSKREKALIGVLVVILLFLLWYQFIFSNVQNQVDGLQTQISDAQENLTIDQTKLTQLSSMQKAIDQYKQLGLSAEAMPSFDNQQNVMNLLNSTLASTTSYTLTFDDLDTSEADIVKRGVTITFGCNTYDEAKAVLLSLQQGPYPCAIDSMNLADTSVKAISTYSNIGSGTSAGTVTSPYAVTAHVIFYEKSS